jgi:putative transcriptional regulator
VAPPAPEHASEGLSEVRRGGAITELLFLYECVTEQPSTLRPIARRLGMTVQAASHSYRRLSEQGLVEVKEGRYRLTLRGVEWLHRALGGLRDDIDRRLDRLHVIRSTRAVALREIRAGEAVSLELRDGVLSARPGTHGESRGRAVHAAKRGGLVQIGSLEGILPIAPGRVRVIPLSAIDLGDRTLVPRLGRTVAREEGLVAAVGLEAYHLLRQASDRTVVRFAVAPSVVEASRLGLSVSVFLLEEELARFLDQFRPTDRPPIEVGRLPERRAARARRG